MDSSLGTFPLLILEEWRKGKGYVYVLILPQIRLKEDCRESMGVIVFQWFECVCVYARAPACVCVCVNQYKVQLCGINHTKRVLVT